MILCLLTDINVRCSSHNDVIIKLEPIVSITTVMNYYEYDIQCSVPVYTCVHDERFGRTNFFTIEKDLSAEQSEMGKGRKILHDISTDGLQTSMIITHKRGKQ